MEKSCSLKPRLREGVGKDVPNQTSLQLCVAQSLWPGGQSQRRRTVHETPRELGPPRHIDVRTELAAPRSVKRQGAIGGEKKKGSSKNLATALGRLNSIEQRMRREGVLQQVYVWYLPKPPGKSMSSK